MIRYNMKKIEVAAQRKKAAEEAKMRPKPKPKPKPKLLAAVPPSGIPVCIEFDALTDRRAIARYRVPCDGTMSGFVGLVEERVPGDVSITVEAFLGGVLVGPHVLVSGVNDDPSLVLPVNKFDVLRFEIPRSDFDIVGDVSIAFRLQPAGG